MMEVVQVYYRWSGWYSRLNPLRWLGLLRLRVEVYCPICNSTYLLRMRVPSNPLDLSAIMTDEGHRALIVKHLHTGTGWSFVNGD